MVRIKSALLAIGLGFQVICLMPVLSNAQSPAADTTMGEFLSPFVDIAIEREEAGVIRFTPIVENVEVGQVQWDFGDGTVSLLRYPTHRFKSAAIPRFVILTLNGNPELTASRFLIPSIWYDFEERFAVQISSYSVEPFFGNFIPESYKEHIRRLSEMPSFHNLQSYLIWLAREEIISSFGRREDVRNPNWGYIILVDPQRGNVDTILGPVYNHYRYDLTSVQEIKYRDNEWQSGLRSIWIEFK